MALRTMRGAATTFTLAGALVLAGCATTGGEDDAMQPTPGATASGAIEPSGGPSDATMDDGMAGDDAMADGDAAMDDEPGEVPAQFDFTAASVVDGATVSGADLAGRDLVLWFWAPWCPTCRAEAPELAEAAARMPEGVEVVGVAGLSGDLAYMQDFIEMNGVDGFTHIADLDGTVWQGFGVTTQATTLFVDDSGEMSQVRGGLTADQIVTAARELASS